jgi:hypothetical protein
MHHPSHHVQPMHHSQASINNDNEKWLLMDSNELFVIRHDSLKKSHEVLTFKLQKERHKRSNPVPLTALEETLKDDFQTFKKSFTQTREMYQEVLSTKKTWLKKNAKYKAKLEKINKELEISNLGNIPEKDFIKFYLFELMKLRKQSTDEPLF